MLGQAKSESNQHCIAKLNFDFGYSSPMDTIAPPAGQGAWTKRSTLTFKAFPCSNGLRTLHRSELAPMKNRLGSAAQALADLAWRGCLRHSVQPSVRGICCLWLHSAAASGASLLLCCLVLPCSRGHLCGPKMSKRGYSVRRLCDYKKMKSR